MYIEKRKNRRVRRKRKANNIRPRSSYMCVCRMFIGLFSFMYVSFTGLFSFRMCRHTDVGSKGMMFVIDALHVSFHICRSLLQVSFCMHEHRDVGSKVMMFVIEVL